MVDLSVEIGGVKFKNPIVVGSATPTMDAVRMKHGIDGGAGSVIAKSLFGEGGNLGRRFPRPRFKLFDYRDYPGYPNTLSHSFTLRSLEECSAFDYPTYMKDINRAKDLIKDDGVVVASLSGSSLDEWKEMCELVNKTNADFVEINNSCPFAADMGVKMGAGAVDLTYEVVKTCAGILKKPFSVKITPQTNDPVAVAKQVELGGAYAVNMSARLSGIMIEIELTTDLFSRRAINVPAILMGAVFGAQTGDVEMYHSVFEKPEIKKIDIKIHHVETPEVQRIRIEAAEKSAMVDARNRGGGRVAIIDARPSREEALAAAKRLGIEVAGS